MVLRGIDFSPVANASGARGFFQEGYWYHLPWKSLGLTWKGTGFIAKTVTIEPRLSPSEGLGNMHLKKDGITPKDFLPSCIVPNAFNGTLLNAVGLSNPGAANILNREMWQRLSEPFHISFMSVQHTSSDRLRELKEFVYLLACCVHQFRSHAGLEMNFSCPNANVNPSSLIQEIGEALDIAGALKIPLQIKVNALSSVAAVCEVAQHPSCSAITMGNTLPWGSLPGAINWKSLFGTEISPLARFGGGGLSGPPLRPVHCTWIRKARDCGFRKAIWGCGGVDSTQAVQEYKAAGANGVQLGTVCMLRPRRMKSIIRCAHSIFH